MRDGDNDSEAKACPIAESLRTIKSIWKLVVIRFLLDGPKGFNELLRTVPEINPKTLSRTLKALLADGLLERRIISTQPFSVEYKLTQKGIELKPVLESLGRWGEKWILKSAEEIDTNVMKMADIKSAGQKKERRRRTTQLTVQLE